MALGERLREARKARKLTQTEFGEIGGVGKFAQIRFEQGVNLPGGEYWLGLSAAGFDVAYILTGRVGTQDAAESELLQRFRAASSDVQGAVLRALGIATSGKKKGSVAISGGSQGQVIAGDLKQRDVTFNIGTSKKKAPK